MYIEIRALLHDLMRNGTVYVYDTETKKELVDYLIKNSKQVYKVSELVYGIFEFNVLNQEEEKNEFYKWTLKNPNKSVKSGNDLLEFIDNHNVIESDHTPTDANPIMACGHSANAYVGTKSVCAICGEEKIMKPQPSLKDRKALCSYCQKDTDSKTTLPFFRYEGDVYDVDSYYCGCWGWD